MRSIQYFLAVVVLCLSGMVFAGDPDPNEPNDDFGNATPLSCFDFSSGLISPDSDVDFFEVSGSPGESVWVDIDAEIFGSSLDTVLGAFNSGGTLLQFSDDDPYPGDGFPGTDSFLIVEMPGDGIVYVGVASIGNEQFDPVGGPGFTEGEYELYVECYDPPPPLEIGDLLASTGMAGGLYSIDTTDAQSFYRGYIGNEGPVTEIEFAPDGSLIGALGSLNSALIDIDYEAATESFRCNHDTGLMTALEYVGGTLYGVLTPGFGNPPSALVTIGDPVASTCPLTTVGATGYSTLGGLAYDVAGDKLYSCNASGANEAELLECNRGSGVCSSIGPMGFFDCASLEFGPDGTLYAGAGGNSGSPGTLYTVDTVTGVTTEVGQTEANVLSGLAFVPGSGLDSDGDGIPDVGDNCRLVSNSSQIDTNGDGIGNQCDADINGPGGADDCVVNFLDLTEFRAAFFSNPASPNWNPDADLTGPTGAPDGIINFSDLALVRESFFLPPGPSGAPNDCLPDLTIEINAPTTTDCTAGPTQCVHSISWFVTNFSSVDVTNVEVRLSIDNAFMNTLTFVLSTLPANTGSSSVFETSPGPDCFDPTCVTTGEVDYNDAIVEFNEENNTAVRVD